MTDLDEIIERVEGRDRHGRYIWQLCEKQSDHLDAWHDQRGLEPTVLRSCVFGLRLTSP